MTDIVQIGAGEQDAIDFFTALLDEHMEKNWDINAVDFQSRVTTKDGHTNTFFHIWSDNWKIWDTNQLPFNPADPPGSRFPYWSTHNKANKKWVQKDTSKYLELRSEGIASKAKSSITVHSTKGGTPYKHIFVHYRIFDNVLMTCVPSHLEKAVVIWAKKNKRHISAEISPLGYWEEQGSEAQKSIPIDDSVRLSLGPRSAKNKPATITPINKNSV